MNTYTKLNSGAWGVRVAGNVAAGASVAVSTKAGATKHETIERVLWTGPDKYSGGIISLCAITPRTTSSVFGGFRAPRGTYAPGGRRCPMCGSRECERAWDPHALCQED